MSERNDFFTWMLKASELAPRYYATWCQLVLAVVEIFVTKIKACRKSDPKSTRNPRDIHFV